MQKRSARTDKSPENSPGRAQVAGITLFGLLALTVPFAATAQNIKKQPSSVSGSPLDTLLSTRLWTTPPPAKDFVRETRPDPGSLDYTPLTGTDPERPKPRDAANVKALQAELEGGIQANEKRAKALGGVSQPAASGKPAGKAKSAAKSSAKTGATAKTNSASAR